MKGTKETNVNRSSVSAAVAQASNAVPDRIDSSVGKTGRNESASRRIEGRKHECDSPIQSQRFLARLLHPSTVVAGESDSRFSSGLEDHGRRGVVERLVEFGSEFSEEIDASSTFEER